MDPETVLNDLNELNDLNDSINLDQRRRNAK
jgi:hypothetical protein